ncbi:MAG: hypothetical protein J0H43_02290, partial [Actinobacteria bacterium]|nr:hypothetical protein [Actinomycetota bacterium]
PPGYLPACPQNGVVLGPGGFVGPTPAPQRGRTLRIVAVVVAVVALCLAGGAYFIGRGSGPGPVSVPESFAGYQRLHNMLSQQIESQMHQMASVPGPTGQIFGLASIGSYSRNSGDSPRLIVFVLRTGDLPASIRDGNAFMEGMSAVLPAATPFLSARHGGSTQCGTAAFATAPETACVWSDPKTSGMLVDVLEGLSPAQLDRVTESLRDSVE